MDLMPLPPQPDLCKLNESALPSSLSKTEQESDPFAIAAQVMRSFGWSCELYKDAIGASHLGNEIMAKFVDPTTVVFVQGKNKKASLGDVTKRQLVIMATLTVGFSRGETCLPQFAEFPPDPTPTSIALEIVRTMARAMALCPRLKKLGDDISERLPLDVPKQLAH